MCELLHTATVYSWKLSWVKTFREFRSITTIRETFPAKLYVGAGYTIFTWHNLQIFLTFTNSRVFTREKVSGYNLIWYNYIQCSPSPLTPPLRGHSSEYYNRSLGPHLVSSALSMLRTSFRELDFLETPV